MFCVKRRSISLLARIILGVVSLLWAPIAEADSAPTDRFLRVDSGMHSARVERISIDAQARYIVTGSHDKTVRVWDAKQRTLLGTLRPPIGAGHEGKIFAVAISPNGRLIAAGGWSGAQWEGSNSIYLFDRESGKMLRRIKGLPSILYHLKFSPDGARVAALLKTGGLRVFLVDSGAEVKADREYQDSATGADFDPSGRLVTSSLDGFIRLYDATLNLIKKSATGGAQPYSARFSPDGSEIAIGYMDAMRVEVRSGQDLRLVFRPELTGLQGEETSAVAWSADGSRLCAGSRGRAGTAASLRCWDRSRPKAYLDHKIGSDAIYDLVALPNQGWVFSSKHPSWGILDEKVRIAWAAESASVDFRAGYGRLLVDQSGGQVQFGYSVQGFAGARFSVENRWLSQDPRPDASLQAAVTSAPGLELTDLQGTRAVKLNGRPLRLPAYETASSLASGPGGAWFVLGTERYVRCFDSSGSERWYVAAPGETQQITISGDGRVVVAAFADGTIRWYRTADGGELLALFPHPDRQRWIAWTPAGYYAASSGGEDLIGWHINRGLSSAADFVPASQLRNRLSRPQVISNALAANRSSEESLRCVTLGLPLGVPAFHIKLRLAPEPLGSLSEEAAAWLLDLGVLSPCQY